MEIFFVLSLVFFFGVWFLAMRVISFFGWKQLAEKYPSRELFVDSWKGWLWGKIGPAAYKGCLWVAVDARGLHMKTLFLFSAFHPPMFIPWSAIKEVQETNYWFMKTYKIVLSDSSIDLMVEPRALKDAQRFLGNKLVLLEKPSKP